MELSKREDLQVDDDSRRYLRTFDNGTSVLFQLLSSETKHIKSNQISREPCHLLITVLYCTLLYYNPSNKVLILDPKRLPKVDNNTVRICP